MTPNSVTFAGMARKKTLPRPTHVSEKGEARMVDVGDKPATRRVAVAEAKVELGAAARRAVAGDTTGKGDILAAARIAGIQAAKRTGELIPLCHPLSLTHVAVELESKRWGVRVVARAETVGPTGVEMEAMTAASVAALTLYDMLKSVERGITISSTRLLEKSGGRSGTWKRR